MLNISTPTWARSTGLLTALLVLCLLVALLVLRKPLLSAWYNNLGYVYLSRALVSNADPEALLEAQSSFSESLRWEDANGRAHWGLGRVYYALGDDGAAVSEWQSSEEALPRLLAWSDSAFSEGDYALALEQALLADTLDARCSSVHYRLGEAYRALGQLDRALEEYEKAKEYNAFLEGDEADLASCYFGQARVYEAMKNWDAAIWHYEAGLKMREDPAAGERLRALRHE